MAELTGQSSRNNMGRIIRTLLYSCKTQHGLAESVHGYRILFKDESPASAKVYWRIQFPEQLCPTTKTTMRHKRRADFLARILNSIGYFRGKTRLANLLGRLTRFRSAIGTFPLPDGKTATVDLGDRIQRLMW